MDKRCHFFAQEPFPAQKSGRTRGRRFDAKDIIDEAARVPDACRHVDAPQPAIVVYGSAAEAHVAVSNPRPCKDTLSLIGAVSSFPVRVDKVAPGELIPWIEAEREFGLKFYGSLLAYIALHLDELYPHLHFLIHNRGLTVATIDPALMAGELVYAKARARGEPKWAANIRRMAGQSDGAAALNKLHHETVGLRFGMAYSTDTPRTREEYSLAKQRQKAELTRDPLNVENAALIEKEIRNFFFHARQVPTPTHLGIAERLTAIGFDPARALSSSVEELQRAMKPDTNKTNAILRQQLSEALDQSRDFPDFVDACFQREIAILLYEPEGRIKGVSFQLNGRAASGTTLDKSRFSWPMLSSALRIDDTCRRTRLAIQECRDVASTAAVYYTADLEAVEVVAAKKARKPIGLHKAFERTTTAEGVDYLFRETRRVAIHEYHNRMAIQAPVPSVFSIALRQAQRRGWVSITISAVAEVISECGDSIRKLAIRLGLEVRFVLKKLASPFGTRALAQKDTLDSPPRATKQSTAPGEARKDLGLSMSDAFLDALQNRRDLEASFTKWKSDALSNSIKTPHAGPAKEPQEGAADQSDDALEPQAQVRRKRRPAP